MGDSFFGSQRPLYYILNLLYCLVPAVLMFILQGVFGNPWVALIVIHIGAMVLVPYILMRVIRCSCLDHADAGMGWGWGGYRNDDLYGLIVGCLWALTVVGIYWLCCTQFGVDLKSILTAVPDGGDPIITCLLIIYWILLASYIEEWFWRNYYHHVLYSNRIFDRLWIALTWGLMYVVLIFLMGGSGAAVAAFIVLGIVGYILDPIIRWEWGYNSMFLCHFGCNAGIAICWYLAGQGKF